MNQHYYLRCGRLITGPFSEQQVQAKFRAGQLTGPTDISPDKQHWEPLFRTFEASAVIPAAVPSGEPEPTPVAEPDSTPANPPEPPSAAGAAPEPAVRMIGSTLQLMWDSRIMQTFLSAAPHPRKNVLMLGTTAGFLLLLTVFSAAALNTVLHRGGDMWFGSILALLTLLAVAACEETLLHVFRPSESVLAETLLLECTGAGAVPVLLFSAGRPLLLRAGFPVIAALWEGTVLAAAAFFTVQFVTGFFRVLIRDYGFSVRTAAVLTAGALGQQWLLVWLAIQMIK